MSDYSQRKYRTVSRVDFSHDGQLSKNAYGQVISQEEDGTEIPLICGHGGSMWLCRSCAEKALEWQKHEDEKMYCGGGI